MLLQGKNAKKPIKLNPPDAYTAAGRYNSNLSKNFRYSANPKVPWVVGKNCHPSSGSPPGYHARDVPYETISGTPAALGRIIRNTGPAVGLSDTVNTLFFDLESNGPSRSKQGWAPNAGRANWAAVEASSRRARSGSHVRTGLSCCPMGLNSRTSSKGLYRGFVGLYRPGGLLC